MSMNPNELGLRLPAHRDFDAFLVSPRFGLLTGRKPFDLPTLAIA